MFENFTERARAALASAAAEAAQYDAERVEPGHLLLGVLAAGGVALGRRYLEDADAAREYARAALEREWGIPNVLRVAAVPLGTEARRVLVYAEEEAERLGHRIVGVDHVLLGLMRERDSRARTLLHELGVRLDAARQALELAGSTVDVEGLPPLRRALGTNPPISGGSR